MNSIDQQTKRIARIEERDGASGSNLVKDLVSMSDDEILKRTRQVLIAHGHPEAETASTDELLKIARAELSRVPEGR